MSNKMISSVALKSKLKIKTLTLNNKISPALRSSIEPLVTSLFAPTKKKYSFFVGNQRIAEKF